MSLRTNWRSSQWSALNTLGPIKVTAIVLRADYRCTHCGCRTLPGKRHVDHLRPRRSVRDDSPSNLVLACEECNLDRRFNDLPSKAIRHGRTRRDVQREIARQTAISIDVGSEMYQRARPIARTWYPAQFARRERAREAWNERQCADHFDRRAAA